MQNLKRARVIMANQLVAASYRMVVGEKRVVMLALAQIDPDDEPTDETLYSVSLASYIAATGLDRQAAWIELVDAADRLISKVVRIDNGKKWERISFTQQCKYDPDTGISIRFSKPILPFISQLKREFTQYRLIDAIAFRSVYTIRIYELLMRYQSTGQCEITLSELRTQLDITAEYKNGGDFKRFVVDRALNEINKARIWSVTVTATKLGRKIDKFIFKFYKIETLKPKKAPSKSPRKPETIPKKFIESHSHLVPAGMSWDEVYAHPPAALASAWGECTEWSRYF